MKEKKDTEAQKDNEEIKVEKSKDISKNGPGETELEKSSRNISKKTLTQKKTPTKVKKNPKEKNTES